MTTREKWILGVALLLLIFAGSYIAFSKPKPQIIPIPPESWPAGCNPNNPGYNMQGVKSDVCAKIYCAVNPGDLTICNSSTDCYNGCSSSRPGYDCNGNKSEYCS